MSTAVRRSIYGRLSGDTTLTNLLGAAAPGYTKAIYDGLAPDGASFPYVLINQQSGVPTEAFHDPSAFDSYVWLAKAVDRNSTSDPAEAIQARIQTLLNDAALTISGGTLLYLRRQSDVQYTEVDDGVQYRHAGALYRVVVE